MSNLSCAFFTFLVGAAIAITAGVAYLATIIFLLATQGLSASSLTDDVWNRDNLGGIVEPCAVLADAADPCATGRAVETTVAVPEVLSRREVVAPAVSIAYAPVPEPMHVPPTPTATPTRSAVTVTPTTVAATATLTAPTPEPTATATMEPPQVEIEATVATLTDPTPESDTVSTESVPTVAPCTPYPGSDKDPCERRVPWEWPRLKNPNFTADIFEPWPPFTTREWVDWEFDYWHHVPHFIVRGVAVPGSTRCAVHGPDVHIKVHDDDELKVGGPVTDIDCYTDIAVREYIFGSGPPRITYRSKSRSVDEMSPDFGTVERDAAYFSDITSPLAESLEGYEWIFWLATPRDASQGAWNATSLWDVQRLEDGSIVGVSRYRRGSDDESVYLEQLEPALDAFTADTKAAMAHYVELYGGRVGESPEAPMLSTSADLSSVYEYIKLMGALDVPGFTYEPPPPSPLTADSASTESVPVVAPCTPFPGSDKDPCERRVPWEWPNLKNPNFVADIWWPWPPYTVRELVDRMFEKWYRVPHFIVRGIAIPGSTRCVSRPPPDVLLKASETSPLEEWKVGTDIDCYTDIAVREYIFGSGPFRVTYASGGRSADQLSYDFGTVERDAAYFADITSPIVESIEGYEWIFHLSTPLGAARAAWEVNSKWSVQRRDDGTVVSVSRYSSGDADEVPYLDKLEPTLDSFVADTKAAMAQYVELYDGRVGESPDAPMLLSSPELSSVYEYIKAMGALEVPGFTYEPPPPSPLLVDLPLADSGGQLP